MPNASQLSDRNLIETLEYHAPDGELFRFDTHTRALISHTGFGMPGLKYLDQRGPFQHGNTLYDYRLEPRIVQLLFRQNGCSRQEYWDNRSLIINAIRPNRNPFGYFVLGTLIIRFPSLMRLAIDVTIEQGPVFAPREPAKWDEWGFIETLRFIAPDPIFYSPDELSASIMAAEYNPHLVLPFRFGVSPFGGEDITFAEEEAAFSTDITYNGNWLSYPQIVLSGPIANPKITNETTGEIIEFVGYTLTTDEIVTISLPYGQKSVISNINGNILGYLTSDSDVATFHIAPSPEAPGGVNHIVLTGTSVLGGKTNMTIKYHERYLAI